MLVYTLRRLVAAIPVLIAASLFTFLLVDLSGDPLAELYVQIPPVPQSTIDAERAKLYLDRNVAERYVLWLTGWGENRGDIGILQGKFGPGKGSSDVGGDIAERFFITFRLVAIATVLSFLVAIVTGVVSAIKQYSLLDHVLTFLAFLGLAMPIFWLAALIKNLGVWFNDNVAKPLFGENAFYVVGANSPTYHLMEPMEKVINTAQHLALPTLALVLNGYAFISRFQRTSMLEVLNSDYVRLARAKGLRNRVVMRRHALRNALIPVVTLGALAVVGALTGAVITETIFRWRGLGTYLVGAIRDIDVYPVMGVVLLSGVLVVVFNLIADLLYAVLDPRIRYE